MEEKGDYNPEEEVVTGNWNTPKVSLKEVEVKTGEEDETLFWSGRSKLYRWVNGEWKERGLGESKLLKHKEKGTIRFLLRQEKTLKIVANHFIYPTESYCKLVPNAGSEKIYAWTVKDFAEEPRIEQFALKFNTPEAAKTFKQKFDEAGENNKKLMNLVDEKGEVKDDVEKGKEKKAENEKEKDTGKDKDKEKIKETGKTGDKKEDGDKKDQDKDKDEKVEHKTKKITEKENEEKQLEGTKETKKEKMEEGKTEKDSVEKNEVKKVEDNNVKVSEIEKKHVESQIDESKKLEKKEEHNSKDKDKKKNGEKGGEEEDNLKREDN